MSLIYENSVSFLNPGFIKTSLIGSLTVRGKDAAGLCFELRPGSWFMSCKHTPWAGRTKNGIYWFDWSHPWKKGAVVRVTSNTRSFGLAFFGPRRDLGFISPWIQLLCKCHLMFIVCPRDLARQQHYHPSPAATEVPSFATEKDNRLLQKKRIIE